jgi:hypothetical protein
MSFLQPLMLFGLPLVAIPILIHLINQWRHRTIPWGAMMFLMTAKRMTRGMAKLRQFLIMAMRMLAIVGLLFAASRPLASGWLGLAAGHPDTTILILDRSASMEQQDVQTGESKRSTGIAKLVELMDKLGTNTQLVLIENTKTETQEISSAKALLDLPDTSATSTAADIAGMVQTAMTYIEANQTGRTDVWICSDLQSNDWTPESGRWKAINSGFQQKEGVRFHLLIYNAPSTGNMSVWAENVRLRKVLEQQELVLDIRLRRDSTEVAVDTKIALTIVVNGARSVVEVDMTQDEYALQGHTIPIDAETKEGWGRIELPTDTNPEDNVFYFVFAEPPSRHTVIVSSEATSAEMMRVASVAPVEIGIEHSAEVITPDQVAEIDWEKAAMVLWNAPIPSGVDAKLLENFAAKGRSVIFFPPAQSGTEEIFDTEWEDWLTADTNTPFVVGTWRDDSDLLSKARGGETLPVGDLRIFQHCKVKSAGNVLARLESGEPLLIRAATDDGGVYFCTTLPQPTHSSLARDGVVFYVMLQRALAAGSRTLGQAQQLTAGSNAVAKAVEWKPIGSISDEQPPFARPYVSGVLEKAEGALVAINRPLDEDSDQFASDEAIERIFSGLDYHRIDDEIGGMSSLANEIWRIFLILMAIALVVEAFLCLPQKQQAPEEVAIAS